ILKNSVKNPIALSAGTDLFQRYVVGVLQSPSRRSKDEGEEDFKAIREQLLENGRLFVERAKEARELIAQTAKGLVREGDTVMTFGESRVVNRVLDAAADDGVGFRVIYVQDTQSGAKNATVERLRGKGIGVAIIPTSAVAYSLGMATSAMVGAEGVVENGGIVSRMGTYQLAMLAKNAGKPVYVVAESHKFVRVYPLGQYDLPVRQRVVDFKDSNEEEELAGKAKDERQRSGEDNEEAVDCTPPELITSLVTEVGVLTPSAVSEELIKIWY
ncbi:MAG: hypothetical protein Q9201_005810, partial [Fulgogasparrea decipioides]